MQVIQDRFVVQRKLISAVPSRHQVQISGGVLLGRIGIHRMPSSITHLPIHVVESTATCLL